MSNPNEDQEAGKPLDTMSNGIVTNGLAPNGIARAVELVNRMEDDLDEIGSFVYVVLDSLQSPERDDIREDLAKVLSAAYVKLIEHVGDDVRNTLKALGQDGGQ